MAESSPSSGPFANRVPYLPRYSSDMKPLTTPAVLVGVAFDPETRYPGDWLTEELPA